MPSSKVDKAILAQVVSLNGCTHSCLILCVHKRILLLAFHLGFSELMLTHFCGKKTCFAIFVTFSLKPFFSGSWIEGFPPLRGPSLWLEFRTLSNRYWDFFHQADPMNELQEVDKEWRQMNLILPTNLDLDLLMRELMHYECLKSTLFAFANFLAIMCSLSLLCCHWRMANSQEAWSRAWLKDVGMGPKSKTLAKVLSS